MNASQVAFITAFPKSVFISCAVIDVAEVIDKAQVKASAQVEATAKAIAIAPSARAR